MGKELRRSKDNRMIAGVCGGIGDYLDIDPVVIRLLWAVGTLVTGIVAGVVLYVLSWVIIPEEEISAPREVQRTEVVEEEEL